jgi:hypothetical protein
MTYVAPSKLVVDYLIACDPSLVDTDPTFGKMIFRDGLLVTLPRTGKRAITVRDTPGDNYPGQMYGTTVSLSIYADHTRDVDGEARQEDGLDRAWEVFGQIDFLMNRGSDPLSSGPPLLQSDRVAHFPTFDPQVNLPYIAVNYSVVVVAAKD